ncbi:MAG: hypothetical protein ABSD96_00715 [Candidatus Korobacteraceae bacterium]
MTRARSRPTKLFWLVVLLFSWLLSAAQIAAALPPVQQSSQSQQGERAKPPESQAAESKISPKEAEELFRSVDEILAFVSKDTGFPIKDKVKRKLANRDEVEQYIARHMQEDKDTQRLERSAASLKKLGLLPRDFELRPFLLGLLKEQVAGFYDAKTKTVYLLDWVDAEAQKPVLAHELTHALQDQSYNLSQWAEDSKHAKSDQEEMALEEAQSAREAVLEGQAMLVLLDYMLAPAGRSVADSPSVVDVMKGAMVEGGQTPMFAKAPLFLREALTFPYTFGLDFERQVMAKKGRGGAYKGVFENPPRDTRQVMEPETYLAGENIPELTVPKLDAVLKGGYKRYDFGGLGQFDVTMLLWQWYGKQTGAQIPQAWRGGYYFTYERVGHQGNPYVLVSLTRWATEAAAKEFASLYAGSLVKRYQDVSEVKPSREGSGEWKTEEGPVEVSTLGPFVIAIEGLAGNERTQVRQAIEHTFIAEPHPARTGSQPMMPFPLEPIITSRETYQAQPVR